MFDFMYISIAPYLQKPLCFETQWGLISFKKLSYFFSEKFINGTLYEAYGEAEVIIAIVGLK